MSALRISPDLALPLDAVTDTIGVLAVKGSGKSYTFMVMAEEMVRSGAPVVIVDVVGVCWGLRVSADGKGDGLSVIVLGGEHGDLPLDPGAGRVLAEFAANERRSIVLDVSAFETKADQIRFVTAFVSRLYEINRQPLHVMIDEADEFIPQKPFGEETRMVRAFEVLVRRGRARGLGITMVTQRPAVLNKNVLSMVGTLIIGRTVSPHDRKAIGEWVDANGTEEQKKTLYGSLASLPTSDKWVWTPLSNIFKRVRIRARETFDSSATPKLGAVRFEPRALAPVDLEALRSKIAETIEKAEADDPKKLRARIAELDRTIKERGICEERVTVVEKPVRDEVLIEKLKAASVKAVTLKNQLEAAVVETTLLSEDVWYALKCAEQPPAPKSSGSNVARPAVGSGSNGVQAASSRPASPEKATPARGSGTLGGGERKILTALAQHPDGLSKVQVALITGYSSNGGGFSNYISALRTRALIAGEASLLQITKSGLAELGSFDPLPRGRALLDHWKREVGGAGAKILEELASVHPRALRKEAVASRTGYEPNGGGFNNAISRLRTLSLIVGRGEVRISEELVG